MNTKCLASTHLCAYIVLNVMFIVSKQRYFVQVSGMSVYGDTMLKQIRPEKTLMRACECVF